MHICYYASHRYLCILNGAYTYVCMRVVNIIHNVHTYIENDKGVNCRSVVCVIGRILYLGRVLSYSNEVCPVV